MAPDVEAYRDATRGRALAIKCRGGLTAPVATPDLGWRLTYSTGQIGTSVPTDDNPPPPPSGGIYEVSGQTIVSLAGMLSPPLGYIVLSATDADGVMIPADAFAPGDQFDLRAYDAANMVTGFLRFGVWRLIPHSGFHELALRTRQPVPTYGPGRMAANDATIRLTAPRDLPTSGAGSLAPPGFEFYGRLESGSGTTLEDGIEVQTVEMICRFDSRHAIGDYVDVTGDSAYNYVITDIDYIGRQKWQTLTMKRLLIPG